MASSAPGEEKVVRVWRWAYEHLLRLLDFLPAAFTLMGAAMFAGASLTQGSLRWGLFIGACVVSLFGLLFSYRNARGVRSLKRECAQERERTHIAHTELKAELDEEIMRLRTQVEVLTAPDAEIASFLLERVLIELSIDDSDSRASLYTRTGGEHTILLARFSRNAKLRLPGSGQYQLDEGAVARGWEKPYSASDMPLRRDHWNSHMQRIYGIPESVVQDLRMQSRSLATVPLFLPQGATTKTVGVLMIEHLDPKKINGNTQDALSEMPNLKALAALCQARVIHAELCS